MNFFKKEKKLPEAIDGVSEPVDMGGKMLELEEFCCKETSVRRSGSVQS